MEPWTSKISLQQTSQEVIQLINILVIIYGIQTFCTAVLIALSLLLCSCEILVTFN